MRILFLTQWFQPEPMFKGLPFAKALQEKGHHVEVLTGFPNYPSGKIYPKYKLKFYQKELIDGILVHRLFLYPSHDRSGIKRLLNYLSFMVSSLFLAPFLTERNDIIYVYNLITLGWTARFLRVFKGGKIVYDVQDMWPESVTNSGMLNNEMLNWILKCWSNSIYRKADHLVVLSPGFKKELMNRKIPDERISIIYNWSDSYVKERTFLSDNIENLFKSRQNFNIVFAGTIGFFQALDVLLEAAKELKQYDSFIKFIVAGSGTEVERLKKSAQKMYLDNVHFVGQIDRQNVGTFLSKADALLVHLKDDPLFRITIPSKTQTYLSIGKPILMGVKGDAADIIKEADCGYCFEPEDSSSLIKNICKLKTISIDMRNKMGENAKNFYNINMSFEKALESFLYLFNNL